MTIKTKIALRYAVVTALLMTVFASVIYFLSAGNREMEFYNSLHKEGLSRANLFLQAKVDAETMHSIYQNNREYIDEVEVAVFDTSFTLVYHDASEIDIVKESQELIDEIRRQQLVRFYVQASQVVGFLFEYEGRDYVVTAAAYDGYGYSKQQSLLLNLLALTCVSIVLSFVLGYLHARKVFEPVALISQKMRDITASKLHLRLQPSNPQDEFGELAASFNKALDIIERSFDSQKMFVSNVSHELRTPLAILAGEIDLALLKQRAVPDYIETLESAKQEVLRLNKLVNGLLDLARADYDESKISIQAVRIDEILLDAREAVLKGNPDYTIDLQFTEIMDEEISLLVLGNEYLLKVAFANLMENSCKFSANQLSTVKISPEEGMLLLTFVDSGIGIPPEDLQHIRTPFYRGGNKDFSSGHGIGLALVQKVVTLHKGNMEVQSVVGQGTLIGIRMRIQA